MTIVGSIADRFEVLLRKLTQWRAQFALARNRELWESLQFYIRQTQSTGCSLIDYWTLYRTIRRTRPLEVLECGTGVSTLVIAHALMENERDAGRRGRVTSMEESAEWLEMSRRLLPSRYAAYVDFHLSETMEDSFSFFRGVRYRHLPARPYDFVFVDGPKYVSPLDGTPTFDFDVVHVLRTTDQPVAGLIDKRVSTCFVLQHLVGPKKLRYSPIGHLGYLEPCTRADLGNLHVELSSANFRHSFRIIGRTKLRMLARPQ